MQVSTHDGAFLLIYLTAYYFCNKSSIIDVRLGHIQASENFEIFKVKLSWNQLLQRMAFPCHYYYYY